MGPAPARVEIIGRQAKGLTQQELAAQAGLSLATLQNIEAENANPSLQTLENLFLALGLNLTVTGASGPNAIFDSAGWEAWGVPLLSEKSSSRGAKINRNSAGLLQRLQFLNPQSFSTEREADAFYGFFWAIKDHYPVVWSQAPYALREWFLRVQPVGRHIQLRRMALSQLGQYL